MSAHVAHILADVGPTLAQAGPYLSLRLTHVVLMSAHVAHILADVGPMFAQACPYLSLMWTHVAHILVDVGPMLAPRPARCPVFRSGPRPKTQNHEKPMVFSRRRDETRRRRRPQNPVKNDVFWTPHAEYTVNYNDNRGPGVNRGWVGGRGGSVYNLRLPPKASGEDTGAGPAPGFKGCRPCRRPWAPKIFWNNEVREKGLVD